jgi:hypothetical protein
MYTHSFTFGADATARSSLLAAAGFGFSTVGSANAAFGSAGAADSFGFLVLGASSGIHWMSRSPTG